MIDALPEVTCLKLRVVKDLLYGCDRVAKHLSLSHRLEKFSFSDSLEEARYRLFHLIDLLLSHFSDVERAPIFLLKELRRHPLAIHPIYESPVGFSSCFTTVDDEVEIAVRTGPKDSHLSARDASAGHGRSRSFLEMSVEIPKSVSMRKGPQKRSLGRDIDLLPLACALAMEMRDKSAHGRVGTGPVVGLRKADAQRRLVGISDKRHASAHGHDLDIGRSESRVRAGLTERSNRGDNQPRLNS